MRLTLSILLPVVANAIAPSATAQVLVGGRDGSFSSTGQMQIWTLPDEFGPPLITIPQNYAINKIEVDTIDQKIYWIEVDGFTESVIKRANYDGSAAETLRVFDTFGTFTVDLVNERMYWVEVLPLPSTIYRSNLDGTNVQPIATADTFVSAGGGTVGTRIYAIDVDGDAGFLFFSNLVQDSDSNSNIHRTELDGANDTVIDQFKQFDHTYYLAVDRENMRVYYTSPGIGGGSDNIEFLAVNYDGTDPEFIFSSTECSNATQNTASLQTRPDLGKIFWLRGGRCVYQADLDGGNIEKIADISPLGLTAFQNEFAVLSGVSQPEPVPTVSSWGMLAMLLLILTTGTILLALRTKYGVESRNS
jgi:hypothetical protein